MGNVATGNAERGYDPTGYLTNPDLVFPYRTNDVICTT
jgi:hypothetical protein